MDDLCPFAGAGKRRRVLSIDSDLISPEQAAQDEEESFVELLESATSETEFEPFVQVPDSSPITTARRSPLLPAVTEPPPLARAKKKTKPVSSSRHRPAFPSAFSSLPSFRKLSRTEASSGLATQIKHGGTKLLAELESKPASGYATFSQLASSFRYDPERFRNGDKDGVAERSYTMFKKRQHSISLEQAYASPPQPNPILGLKSKSVSVAAKKPTMSSSSVKNALPARIRNLLEMFPDVDLSKIVYALAKAKDNEEDAALILSEYVENGKPAVLHPPPILDSPETAVQVASTKRELKQPHRTIRDKYNAPIPARPQPSLASVESIKEVVQLSTLIPDKKQKPAKRRLVQKATTVAQQLTKPYNNRRVDIDVDSGDSDESQFSSADKPDSYLLHVLSFFNTAAPQDISDLASCSTEMANAIVLGRPWKTLEDIRHVDITPQDDVKKKRRIAAGNRIVDTCSQLLDGFAAVDQLIARCEKIGKELSSEIAKFLGQSSSAEELDFTSMPMEKLPSSNNVIQSQPSLLSPDVKLKNYQVVGVNWLHLVYRYKLSCILADEMGLGKTCQVISFLALLLEKGQTGPHLVVVPSSTLENWLREFRTFCPTLKVEAYYGSQSERADIRYELEKKDYNVLVTTYNLATGAKEDRSFLKRLPFNVCVYDEGHLLKNNMSSRYMHLMTLKANCRVLLTGTPLQNNLKELISLLSFILPKIFADAQEHLGTVFKLKPYEDGEQSSTALLSAQRIKRARNLMLPFVLRRKKKQVLKDLPDKLHTIEYCDMPPLQQAIYDEIKANAEKSILAKATGEQLKKDQTNNILMQLRKAANHPMLFRRHYTPKTLITMSKMIMQEERYIDANQQYIYEDMEVMSDFELHRLCLQFPNSIGQFASTEERWMNAAKVKRLRELLPLMKERNDRVLIFSQFTQILDILEVVLTTTGYTYLRMDGQTPVDIRQDMIDQFHEETDITVFLLSTKAGGFGINLACANVVIIHDGSFNPHDDKQAEDRAHRVGQTKDVQVIRLVSRNTIEVTMHPHAAALLTHYQEYILNLANTKLVLDDSVSHGTETDNGNDKVEKIGEKLVAQMMIDSGDVSTPANGTGDESRAPTPPAEPTAT